MLLIKADYDSNAAGVIGLTIHLFVAALCVMALITNSTGNSSTGAKQGMAARSNAMDWQSTTGPLLRIALRWRIQSQCIADNDCTHTHAHKHTKGSLVNQQQAARIHIAIR